MKRLYCVWLGSFVLLFFAIAPVFAQGAHSLQGKVITPDGSAPVQPVKVTLTFSGRRIYETFTDLGGNFSFSGLKNGTYQLTAEGDGVAFETTSVSAEVTGFGSSQQTFTQNIQLRPKQVNATPRPGVVSAFKQDVPKAARETFERAKKLADQGKVDMALSLMREALKLFSEYFEAHLELGNELLQTGHLDEAIAELDQARKINPNDDRTYQSFGLILMRQQKYSIAVGVFAEASRLNPTNPMNPLMRATALIHQASTIEPAQSATARSDREFLLARAEVALTQASDLSGKKLTADHLTLAMFYEMKGERERAAGELEEYLRKNPNIKNADSISAAIKKLREVK
jgi:tetratricopeptide (TPR) repeat protein